MVEYEGNNTEAYLAQPDIFTLFERQSGKVNRKSHYTSLNGEFAMAYSECGQWTIQLPSLR